MATAGGTTVTTDQILLGVGLTVALAVGSQLLASRLRIPALIVLLPVGFAAGALTDVVNPDKLLGSLFQPLVSLSVAVILFDAGLGLDLRKLQGHTRRVVRRLIVLGVPVTWAFATISAVVLLGMPKPSAVMLGAILVVSGPTVVGPLLNFVRPTERVQRVLIWEGSLIDPVGAILGGLVFHAVVASSPGRLAAGIGQFLASVGVGLAGGVIGTALLWLLLQRLRLAEVLGTQATIATVVAVAAACDIVREDTGLIAAIVVGLGLANLPGFDIAARRPFFETVIQLIIGVLFISISATVTPDSLQGLVLPTLGLVAVLVLLARPLVALASTLWTDLSTGERGFIGWMAPRGIVAASTASTFSVTLVAKGTGRRPTMGGRPRAGAAVRRPGRADVGRPPGAARRDQQGRAGVGARRAARRGHQPRRRAGGGHDRAAAHRRRRCRATWTGPCTACRRRATATASSRPTPAPTCSSGTR
jgi:NhaP-type Na+/H+ or K+/H+ antiporter